MLGFAARFAARFAGWFAGWFAAAKFQGENMQNYIFVILTGPDKLSRKAVQVYTSIDPEEVVNALAVNWEQRFPGQKCFAAFQIHGDHTMKELNDMEIPLDDSATYFLLED